MDLSGNPRYCYHTASPLKREEILEKGLLPGEEASYGEPGVYLWRRRWVAETFHWLDSRELLDVWRVDVSGVPLDRDPEDPSEAVYTTKPIPPKKLRFVGTFSDGVKVPQDRAQAMIDAGVPVRPFRKVRMAENPSRQRFLVRSIKQGLDLIRHPAIRKNFAKALCWRPKNRIAVLVPCAGTKPFPKAPSHKQGYLAALDGKKADLWVVSEPLGVVPYEWNSTWPNDAYDYPPKFLRGQAWDELAERVAEWLAKVAPKYQKVFVALPGHHERLLRDALEIHNPGNLRDATHSQCLDQGACPSGHGRATSTKYRRYLSSVVKNPQHVHLFSFDPARLDKVRAVIERGSGFSISRVYTHPTKGHLYILEVVSPHQWNDLDLDANSGSSPLLRLRAKPRDLSVGMTVERFEEIYGQSLGRPIRENPDEDLRALERAVYTDETAVDRLAQALARVGKVPSAEAFLFFFRNSHSTKPGPRKIEGAIEDAVSEAEARRRGWRFHWDHDPSGCLGCECDSPTCKCSTGEEHETLDCLLRDAEGEVVGSIGGVCGLTRDYRRILEAQIASEALHEQDPDVLRNPDEDLRALERAAKAEPGNADLRRRLFAAELRAGRISQPRARLAALLGDADASTALGVRSPDLAVGFRSPEGVRHWVAALANESSATAKVGNKIVTIFPSLWLAASVTVGEWILMERNDLDYRTFRDEGLELIGMCDRVQSEALRVIDGGAPDSKAMSQMSRRADRVFLFFDDELEEPVEGMEAASDAAAGVATMLNVVTTEFRGTSGRGLLVHLIEEAVRVRSLGDVPIMDDWDQVSDRIRDGMIRALLGREATK